MRGLVTTVAISDAAVHGDELLTGGDMQPRNPQRRLQFSGQGNDQTWGLGIECNPPRGMLDSISGQRNRLAGIADHERLGFQGPVTDCSAEPTSERPADQMGGCRLMADLGRRPVGLRLDPWLFPQGAAIGQKRRSVAPYWDVWTPVVHPKSAVQRRLRASPYVSGNSLHPLARIVVVSCVL